MLKILKHNKKPEKVEPAWCDLHLNATVLEYKVFIKT